MLRNDHRKASLKVLQFICHLDVGGAETFVKELSCEMRKQGHVVHVLLLDQYRESKQAIAGRDWLEAHSVPVYSLGRQPGELPLAALRGLVSRLRLERYDVIHSHLPLPDVVATAAFFFGPRSSKHVSTIHNSNLSADGRAWHLSARLRSNVFCSQAASNANKAVQGRRTVISNGTTGNLVPLTAQKATGLRTSFGVASNDVLLLNIGRVETQKNQEALVRAVAAIRMTYGLSYHALIVGQTSPSSPDLGALAQDLGVGDLIHMTGPRSDVGELLQAADMFVSTSLWEGLPISVLEAMFSGIPCCLSNLPEHLEIATGVDGVSFADLKVPGSFASQIVSLASQRLVSSDLRSSRANMLKKYSIESCAEAYIQFYS